MARHQVEDEGRVVIVEGRGSTVFPFLLGALMGAGVALLFAPASGEETQRRIRRKVRELRALAEEKVGEVGEIVSDRVDQVRSGTRDAIDAGRSALDKARQELEDRLEEARARRGGREGAGHASSEVDEDELEI